MNYAFEDIIRALRSARLSKGLSQHGLGQRVGLPQSHISKIEKGATSIRLSSLVQIARALDCEIRLVPRAVIVAVDSLVKASASQRESNATKRAYDPIHRAPPVVHGPAEPRQVPAYRLDDDDDA